MAHNILYYNSIDGGLKQFSNTDVAQLSEYVLELMAAGTYAGTITLGTSNPIGTFTDTVRVGGVGSTDVTILSNTYTLSQVNTVQSTTNPPMYVGVLQEGSNTIIQENATSLNDLADEIIQTLISNYGVNSYYLGVNPPGDGGTWVSRGALTDTLENFTVTNSDYKLWHKTVSATYSSYKAPLKVTLTSQLQEWSNTEIQNLIKTVEERIVATGLGSYALQTSVPGTGTWTAVGTVEDVRRDILVDPMYTGPGLSYTATYQGDVPTTYTGPGASYIGSYVGVVPAVYTGTGLSYTGTYDGLTPTNYTLTSSFQGTFAGPPTYFGPVTYNSIVNYTNIFSSPTYFGPQTYTADLLFVGPDNTTYLAPSYSGPTFAAYTTTYVGFAVFDQGIIYLGPGEGAYLGGNYIGPNFTQYNAGPGLSESYVGTAPNSTNYEGPNPYTGQGGFGQLYTGVNPDGIVFSGVYTGPSGTYTGNGTVFTNPDGTAFLTNFTGVFTAPASFTNPDATPSAASYIGPIFTSDTAVYTGDVAASFNGTAFLAAADYTGTVATNFEGSSFLATTDFVGVVPTDFSGPVFNASSDYTGPSLVVANTSIISSATLWKRIS